MTSLTLQKQNLGPALVTLEVVGLNSDQRCELTGGGHGRGWQGLPVADATQAEGGNQNYHKLNAH
jgi:hypothetical protein